MPTESNIWVPASEHVINDKVTFGEAIDSISDKYNDVTEAQTDMPSSITGVEIWGTPETNTFPQNEGIGMDSVLPKDDHAISPKCFVKVRRLIKNFVCCIIY